MVGGNGLEPMTFCIQDRRSNHLGSRDRILTFKEVNHGPRYREISSGRVVKNRSISESKVVAQFQTVAAIILCADALSPASFPREPARCTQH